MRLDVIDWKRVVASWRTSGRTEATISRYLYWARRYVGHCVSHGADLAESLREAPVKRFFAARARAGDTLPAAATRALWCALAVIGHDLQAWRAAAPNRRLVRVVREFVEHRLRHRGVAIATTRCDAEVATAFLRFLNRRGHGIARAGVSDIEEFIEQLARRWAPKSVATACSTLRAFLGYVFATGRSRRDLTPLVVSPRIRRLDRPPRALPWADIQRILRAIDVREGLGPRDFAIFLMMAMYGMGAGEITGLTLDDIDWATRTIHMRRPKTGTDTRLPLLDPVARALARYLRHHRPAHARDRTVFVSHRMPHARLGGASALRHRLAMYAGRASVRADYLGTHVFRHTHATRQIESGVSAKIVGDILGHRRPESTSAYVRGALAGLRSVGLPVPR